MPQAKRPKSPTLTLEITNELIGDAVQRDSSHCLWAEAVKAAFPDARHVSVDLQTIRFSDPKKELRYTYLTPRVAQVALVQFDQGILPDPHSVQIRRGQVTRMSSRVASKKELTPAQKTQRAKASAASKVSRERLAKSTLRKDGTAVLERTGGKTPPLAAGKRRAFGLRGLQY